MELNLYGTGRYRPGSKLQAAIAAAILLGAASEASAFFDDRLQVFVGESVARDSNVFRISDSADPQGTIGSSERGDTFHATTVGVNLDTPVSRQRIQAGIDWSQVRYHRFTSLDHIDRNGHANWLWQGGDKWSGLLGYAESRTLASFTNFQGATPNPLTTKTLSGTANYLMNPHWEFQAIGSEMRQRNGLTTRQSNDVDVTGAQLGVNYISTASNRVGINVRQDDGRYPNLEPIGALLVKNDYVQRSVGASTDWTITAKSHLAARIDHVQRDYEQFSSRDYNGTIFRAAYDWLPTAKTSVSFIAQRDISPSEDVQTSFVLVKGIAITPSYAFSEKVRLTASLSSSIRDYMGDPGIAGATTSFAGREDRVHAGSITLTYTPMRALTTFLSVQRETRSSNQALLDYTSNLVQVSARLTF